MDISSGESGRAECNFEHRDNPQDIIGRVIFIKKIFSAKDCTDEDQRKHYDQVQLPCIYGIVRLFDDSGHEAAKALAAVLRDSLKTGDRLMTGFSVEGSTLSRDGNELTSTVFRRVSATFKECNKSATLGILSDPNDPSKKEVTKAEHQHPLYVKLGGFQSSVSPIIEEFSPTWVNLEIQPIVKALEAGNYNAAPGTLSGGAALQKESIKKKMVNIVKAAIRDWDRTTPFRKFLKHRLPEVSDEFLDHFTNAVEDLTIKKSQQHTLKELVKAKVIERVEEYQKLNKFEQLYQELRKDGQQTKGATPKGMATQEQKNTPVDFNGKKVKPGLAYIRGNKQLALLGHTPTHLIGVDPSKLSSWGHNDLQKIPRASGISVQDYPEIMNEPGTVDHQQHTDPKFTRHEDVKSLIHGFDFNGPRQHAKEGINRDQSFWAKNSAGKRVYVKGSHDESGFDEPGKEALYHNLARDFFGMGHTVVPTGIARDPRTGQRHAVIQAVKGQHLDTKNPEHTATLKALSDSGELHKMAMMNVIMDNHDRHRGNFMMTPGGMKLIDHGYAFSPVPGEEPVRTPDYIKYDMNLHHPGQDKEFHPEAAKWLQGLNPNDLAQYMHLHGIDQAYGNEAARRLQSLQVASKQGGATIGSMLKAPFSHLSSDQAQQTFHGTQPPGQTNSYNVG